MATRGAVTGIEAATDTNCVSAACIAMWLERFLTIRGDISELGSSGTRLVTVAIWGM
jgi:hypothetical protein